MLKKTLIAALVSFALVAPAAAAADHPEFVARIAPRVALRLFAQVARLRVRHGVRTGQITPAELAQHRQDAAAFRAQLEALRDAPKPLTAEQRQSVRDGVRRLNREIYEAIHNDIRTAPLTR
jgi:hypothetical protein